MRSPALWITQVHGITIRLDMSMSSNIYICNVQSSFAKSIKECSVIKSDRKPHHHPYRKGDKSYN